MGWLEELIVQDIRSIPRDLIPRDVLSKLSLFPDSILQLL